MLKLKIRNICRCCSVGVVAFVVVCGWSIAIINSHPIVATYNSIGKNNQTNKLHTPASHEHNLQSIHSTQSSSTKTTITNQPSTTHFIKYENVIYKLTLSTDGNNKRRRWIYVTVTPLYNQHHNETKGNDVSGHTGNKRTVMKVSNATIPITLSSVHHTKNVYENFNHNNRNHIRNGNISRTFLNVRQNGDNDNRKLDIQKLSHIEMQKATIHKNIQQSNNGITNKSNDKFSKIEEYQASRANEKAFAASLRNDKNQRFNVYHRRHSFNPFDKNLFANDDVVNKNRFLPLIKTDFVKNLPNGKDLSTYQRYTIPTTTAAQSSTLIPSSSFLHLQQSNKIPQNDYYRSIEGRHRKYILRSNPFYSGAVVAGNYGFWNGQNESLDPNVLQLMFTHHESILPQPHFWGIRGYGLYSYAAGNDLHNNLPNGRYKVERDFDN
ncbi:myb-like protein D [Bradysia coprophila]|uniref:myb-like protein D n=1 Tax=Bradysia coprophila TaxID=38358 RepID=UPI00187D888E|nr:myb-like protein D [Bradysia coprophila]